MNEKRKIHAYHLMPIDHWKEWTPLHEYIAEIIETDSYHANMAIDKFSEFWEAGKRQAIKLGWEGDIRGYEIFVSGLPMPDGVECFLLVGFKQDNNGSTFILSEIPLDYLKNEGDGFPIHNEGTY